MKKRTSANPLLDDLKRLVTRIEADLLARSDDSSVPEIGTRLRGEYDRARAARRTAATFEEWRTERITQAAVAWVLSCVFVRFLEDNDLIAPPRIAGPGDRVNVARDSHQHYFQSHPRETDRDYLLSIFDELAALPGTADIFGVHNALREIPNWLSGDAAKEILQFFQKIDANTGLLVHDFSSLPLPPGEGRGEGAGAPPFDTRFLGDLYQDLSAYARERYALLQTPHFVEQFLLDRTLEPALDEFGLTEAFKMIDPACGSGHLVLGSFDQILDRWQRKEPATPARELVRRTLHSVHGVDINPFAVAIARFRLLLVAMRACDVSRLADAPAFHLNIECGDSLLHAPRASGQEELFDKGSRHDADDECDHAYASENLTVLKKLLRHGQYHAVMANPPYITPKDPGLRDRYRDRFDTCHMKYSLAVPFMEHIFKLCVPGGFTGQITADTFMTRAFGKRLVEHFLPTIDLSHVIHTKGVPLPGHGTSTVILFGRYRSPVTPHVRAVKGIRGEPPSTDDPSRGFVWTAITTQVDQPGSQSEFVSVADTPREAFHSHPWSIGGGGASDLKEQLEATSRCKLESQIKSIGFASFPGTDEAFVSTGNELRRSKVKHGYIKAFVPGDVVRDWRSSPDEMAFAPYDHSFASVHLDTTAPWAKRMWRNRTVIGSVVSFGGKTRLECGDDWWTWYRWVPEKYRTAFSIAFAFVSTHNHFVLDRGGKVFNRSAPVIKLPANATEDDHLGLLGTLNSSVACFWMKQVFHSKGNQGIDCGMKAEEWEPFWEFGSTPLLKCPLPTSLPLDLTRELQKASDTQSTLTPVVAIARWAVGAAADPPPSSWPTLKRALEDAAGESDVMRRHRIALQEELDWQCYRLYGLIDTALTYGKPVPPICLGERAFEIALARRVAAGDTTTTWFERHGSTPITEIPAHWPADYRDLVQKRLDAIESIQNIRLIEQPEYKRRWSTEPWADQQSEALERFLLARLERLFDFDGRMNDSGTPTASLPLSLVSLGDVADAARRDPLFMEAAEVFTGDVAFDVLALVTKLVDGESVPLLPVLCYKPSGLRKHAEWQGVWAMQRQEDSIDARTSLDPKHPHYLPPEQAKAKKQAEVGDIPVPPKYTSADFLKAHHWRLRGKLDVPKEQFISFPHIIGPDGTLIIAWAGLDHLQLAKAIGDFYGLVQTEYGGSDDPRLIPLLANLQVLIPWVRQWHTAPLTEYAGPPADFYDQFLRDEAAAKNLTPDQLQSWQLPVLSKRAGRPVR